MSPCLHGISSGKALTSTSLLPKAGAPGTLPTNWAFILHFALEDHLFFETPLVGFRILLPWWWFPYSSSSFIPPFLSFFFFYLHFLLSCLFRLLFACSIRMSTGSILTLYFFMVYKGFCFLHILCHLCSMTSNLQFSISKSQTFISN